MTKNTEENHVLSEKNSFEFSSKNAHLKAIAKFSRLKASEEKEKTGAVGECLPWPIGQRLPGGPRTCGNEDFLQASLLPAEARYFTG